MRVKAVGDRVSVGIVAFHHSTLHGMEVVQAVWNESKLDDPIVTGAQEQGHSDSSLHYGRYGVQCRAFDVRIPSKGGRRLGVEEVEALLGVLRLLLGRYFDVVLEWRRAQGNRPREMSHIHIEADDRNVGKVLSDG